MKDERTLKEMEEGIRRAVARIGLPLDTPEFEEAIRQLAAALAPKNGGFTPLALDDTDESRHGDPQAME